MSACPPGLPLLVPSNCLRSDEAHRTICARSFALRVAQRSFDSHYSFSRIAPSEPTRTAPSSRHERVENMAFRVRFACCYAAGVGSTHVIDAGLRRLETGFHEVIGEAS